MSKGLICDHCGTVLPLNAKGEAANGEGAAWLVLSTGAYGTSMDACTRSCAHELLDGEFGQQIDAEHQVIAEIARVIREDDESAA